jgi:HlyD family secretion protein
VLGLVALAGAAAAAWFTVASPLPVVTTAPRRGSLIAEAFGTGTLEAKVVVSVSAKMVGKVVEVLVDQGNTIAAGQLMARLEAKDYSDAVRVTEAQKNQAEAELAKATLDAKRSRELYERKLISEAEHDIAETDARVAQARLEIAAAALGVARAKLADTRIVSPVRGLVITRNLEVGSTVVPGAPIFRLADTRVLWVQALVDERATGHMRLGQVARVVFETDPDSTYAGHIARLGTETDRVTEEREVDVTLDRWPSSFFLGQRADVHIQTARREHALQVPKSALVARGGTPGLFVVDRGRARWRPVQLGLGGRGFQEIASGIDEQARVIVNPLAGKKPVADGQRVTATHAPSHP